MSNVEMHCNNQAVFFYSYRYDHITKVQGQLHNDKDKKPMFSAYK